MKIIITSFGPFQDFKMNPSHEVMQLLKNKFDKEGHPELHVEWKTLDVSYSSVAEFKANISNQKTMFLLHMGVAANEPLLRLEIMARNECFGQDITGLNPSANFIYENGGNLKTNISLDFIHAFISRHSEKVRISEDAGTYLCNFLYYNSLAEYGTETPVLFAHIADYMTNKKAVNAIEQTELLYEFINNFVKDSKQTYTSI